MLELPAVHLGIGARLDKWLNQIAVSLFTGDVERGVAFLPSNVHKPMSATT